MARLASSTTAQRRADSDLEAAERFYRDLIAGTAPPADLEWEPVRIGPTWQWRPDGTWILPDATLGWGVLAWCSVYLTGRGRQPWRFTPEQARFLLWYYAVDDAGDFLYHSGMLQRLKGWGKDPLGACVAAASLHAPVVFDYWIGDRPVGHDEPDAWTQIVGAAQDQTKNTMKLFPSLIPESTRRRYGMQIGKLNVWSDGDQRQIEAITSSPAAIEGGRPKQILRNETQNWDSSNGGHDLAGAIEGNAAKAEMTAPARVLDIFNAFRPGRDSVAERAREAWESTQGEDPENVDYGMLLDSLEAPPGAPLTRDAAPGVIRSIAGDAAWLDVRPNGRIMKSILNPENPASESRRKWYNQIEGVEDAWCEPRWIDQCIDKTVPLVDGDLIAMFGDGSKSDDATGLVACRLSDGYCETLHFQHPRRGEIVSRSRVDAAVEDAFRRFKILAFYFDPSHAVADDQEDDDRFWWPLVDDWHARYRLRLKMWPVQTGPHMHSVAFDMTRPANMMIFQPAVTQAAEDLEAGIAKHHGGARLRQHMKNARRREGRYGPNLGKENRSSKRKIDLAVCFVGARMLRRQLVVSRKFAGKPGKRRIIAMD